jgi:hypothetical protein
MDFHIDFWLLHSVYTTVQSAGCPSSPCTVVHALFEKYMPNFANSFVQLCSLRVPPPPHPPPPHLALPLPTSNLLLSHSDDAQSSWLCLCMQHPAVVSGMRKLTKPDLYAVNRRRENNLYSIMTALPPSAQSRNRRSSHPCRQQSHFMSVFFE